MMPSFYKHLLCSNNIPQGFMPIFVEISAKIKDIKEILFISKKGNKASS
jgi:hypothetical protein